MTENTDNISNINVDAIVYLIKCMSHSMYYKVQNQYGASEMPIIKYIGNNLELLYQEMHRTMGEQGAIKAKLIMVIGKVFGESGARCFLYKYVVNNWLTDINDNYRMNLGIICWKLKMRLGRSRL